MKKTLLPLLILLLLSACESKEDQAKHDAMVAQKARAELMAEIKAKEEVRKKAEETRKKESKLQKVGIEVEGSKIIIDTNKTKTFFKQITQKLQKKVEKIQQDLQKGKLEDNQTGIEINQEKIKIDLNKTKGFLESWGKKMQEVMQSVDEVTKQIEPVMENQQRPDTNNIK
jgi:ATP-dependent protease HslVU (ClpYQ) ATPase subunit